MVFHKLLPSRWILRRWGPSYSPYKGDAAYYSIRVGERVSENAIWSYEYPYPAVAEIAGRLAFYPDRVDAIEVMTA